MQLWHNGKNGEKPAFHRPVALLRGGDYRDGWEAGRQQAFTEIRADIKSLAIHVSGGLICYGVLAVLVGLLVGYVLGKLV